MVQMYIPNFKSLGVTRTEKLNGEWIDEYVTVFRVNYINFPEYSDVSENNIPTETGPAATGHWCLDKSSSGSAICIAYRAITATFWVWVCCDNTISSVHLVCLTRNRWNLTLFSLPMMLSDAWRTLKTITASMIRSDDFQVRIWSTIIR